MSGDVMVRVTELAPLLEAGNFERLREQLSPNFFASTPAPDDPSAADRFADLALELQGGLPDLTATLSDLREDGDVIRASLTLRGTHTADLWGAPASGSAVTWTTPVSIRDAGGGLAVRFDKTSTPEIVGLLRQFGLVNPPDEMDQPPRYAVAIADFLLKVVFTGQPGDKECAHLEEIRVTEPTTSVCEQCIELGDIWPALRMCLICGFVGCCDTSKNKHMAAHSQETGHAIMRSINGDEGWVWCYEDDAFFEKRTFENYC